MPTLATGDFQRRFLEFKATDPLLIEATVARAGRMVSPRVWCAQWEDGVGLLTAHWLRLMPFGTNTATAPAQSAAGDDYDATPYGKQFRTMRDGIVAAYVGGGTW